MSTHTHTPGPWWAVENRVLCGDRNDPEVIADTLVDDIMAVNDDNQEANARLIAAAPEMLELLITAYNTHRPHAPRRCWCEKARAMIFRQLDMLIEAQP